MTPQLVYIGTAGLTVYAKPDPQVADPWATDVIALTEVSSGRYTVDLSDNPANNYLLFSQAGGSPADTDTPLGRTVPTPLPRNHRMQFDSGQARARNGHWFRR